MSGSLNSIGGPAISEQRKYLSRRSAEKLELNLIKIGQRFDGLFGLLRSMDFFFKSRSSDHWINVNLPSQPHLLHSIPEWKLVTQQLLDLEDKSADHLYSFRKT